MTALSVLVHARTERHRRCNRPLPMKNIDWTLDVGSSAFGTFTFALFFFSLSRLCCTRPTLLAQSMQPLLYRECFPMPPIVPIFKSLHIFILFGKNREISRRLLIVTFAYRPFYPSPWNMCVTNVLHVSQCFKLHVHYCLHVYCVVMRYKN